jgi:GTP-binding protein
MAGRGASAEPESETARGLFALPVSFEMGVVDLAQLPPADVPEVAFAGRSNVGKSSLLNALVGRKKLARASSEPGRTREINFFRIGDQLRLVDLPGYGYAKAPKTEIARWNALVRDYLRGRQGLKRLFLLVDARHGLKANDGAVMDTLDLAALTYQIVLTKTDKISAPALAALIQTTRDALAKRPAAHPAVLAASAHESEGLSAVRDEIAGLL